MLLTLFCPRANVSIDELDLLDHILAMDERGDLTDEEVHHRSLVSVFGLSFLTHHLIYFAQLRDNMFLFFLAGHDTSASGLTSALTFWPNILTSNRGRMTKFGLCLLTNPSPSFRICPRYHHLIVGVHERAEQRGLVRFWRIVWAAYLNIYY